MFHVSENELEWFFQGITYQAVRWFRMCEVGLTLSLKPLCAMNFLLPVYNASGLSSDPRLRFIVVIPFTLRR